MKYEDFRVNKDIMKRLQLLLFVPLALLLTYCAPNKPKAKYFNDGIVNLAGMWVLNADNQTELNILLGIDLNEGSTDINVMGQQVRDYRMISKGNQFLLSYETIDGQKFNVLARMEGKDEMRISRTEEAVDDIIPIGQIGEKVYRLKRLNPKETFMARSNVAAKK